MFNRLLNRRQPTLTGGRQELLEMLPKHSVGAEIGVHKGDFSARILDAVEPRELHLVDPWRYEPSEEYKDAWYGGQAKGRQDEMDDRYRSVQDRFSRQIRGGSVKVHRSNSKDMLEQFDDAYFDWVYIDGNHLYEFVREDLQLSLRKTKPGAYITGDDYTDHGWWQGGVKRAVDGFVSSTPVTLVSVRDDQFVIKKNA